jgi:SAM-dependent methyltransferase
MTQPPEAQPGQLGQTQPRPWQRRADELAGAAYADGAPTSWFDRVYSEGAAGTTSMPWDRETPHPLLADWAAASELRGEGRRAVVVGCGLGADAEFVAGAGYATTGFDLAPAAIAEARRRYTGSAVDYRVADLTDLPSAWGQAFDLVVEIHTLQAVPDPPRTAMAAGVRSLLAPGGTLVLIAFRHDGSVAADDGPPFPLTEEFVTSLATDGVQLVGLERHDGPLWRAVYRG